MTVPQRRFDIMVHPGIRRRRMPRRRGGRSIRRSIRWFFHTRYLHDFDGDGLLDALVPLPKRAYCPMSVKHAIYITRCSGKRCCGHRAGTLGGGYINVAKLKSTAPGPSGFKPIEIRLSRTERRHKIPDRVSYVRRYAFDKGRYKLVHEKRRAGRCHHCSSSPCTGPIRIYNCPLALPEHLDFAAIKAGMSKVANLARACAKRPLKTAGGRVVQVSVTVKSSGVVTKSSFYKHDPVSVKLKRCIRRALVKTRFPRFCAATSRFSSPLR